MVLVEHCYTDSNAIAVLMKEDCSSFSSRVWEFCCLYLQRRAGVSQGGVGPYVNLPMAWTELAQLAQCKGKIQEGVYIEVYQGGGLFVNLLMS